MRDINDLEEMFPFAREGQQVWAMMGGKPYEETYIPTDTSAERRLIQRLAGDRVNARQQVLDQARREAERANFRTLYNLGGSTLFKALSGAPVDTRLAEELRLGQQARQRALEIERENLLARPEILGQAALQAATLEREEQTGNAREQERVRAANAGRQDQALERAVGQYNTVLGQGLNYQAKLADLEQQQDAAALRASTQRQIAEMENERRLLEKQLEYELKAYENPAILPTLVRYGFMNQERADQIGAAVGASGKGVDYDPAFDAVLSYTLEHERGADPGTLEGMRAVMVDTLKDREKDVQTQIVELRKKNRPIPPDLGSQQMRLRYWINRLGTKIEDEDEGSAINTLALQIMTEMDPSGEREAITGAMKGGHGSERGLPRTWEDAREAVRRLRAEDTAARVQADNTYVDEALRDIYGTGEEEATARPAGTGRRQGAAERGFGAVADLAGRVLNPRPPAGVDPGWTDEDEATFQAEIRRTPWFREYVADYGEEPNLDTPDYDYRRAWEEGLQPERSQADGKYHWPSDTPGGAALKGPNHPTRWKQTFVELTGRDPDDLGFDREAAQRYLVAQGIAATLR